MVGAGIFALLGEVGATAGSAAWMSFAIGGVVAILSGLSYARLGVAYPSSGGLATYLVKGWGDSSLTGIASVMFLASVVIGLAMVAAGFGAYASSLVGIAEPWGAKFFAVAAILVLTWVNLVGSDVVGKVEATLVVVKVGVLLVFMAAGMSIVKWPSLAPSTYPPAGHIMGSLAISYFAYTGFAVITNTAGDLKDPAKQLPRALLLAICFTAVLYIGLSLVVFGTLSPQQASTMKETVLAEAAKPVFGQAGFAIIGVTALISSASAINASLFSAGALSKEEALEDQLPRSLLRKVGAAGTSGLVFVATIACALAVVMDLSAIALLGSVTNLLVSTIVHFGHFRVRSVTKASWLMVALAAVANGCTALLCVGYELSNGRPMLLIQLGLLLGGSAVLERWVRRGEAHGRDAK